MRKAVKKNKFSVTVDPLYNSALVAKLINYVMVDGKKATAKHVVYDAFALIKQKTNKEPLEVFEEALRNAAPLLEVKSRRIGGANYQVPREVRADRRKFLGLNWIIEAAQSKKGKAMADKLAEEILLAAKGEGNAIRKRNNVHAMAEANKAFAHFSW
ncbi:30S ribosomal protein S7 [Patescibacteria group bacterium]|jgi:small subunit ribosomal protein S7|nr:30S ribosomal protein S7 [Patescibacteria group bacterium]